MPDICEKKAPVSGDDEWTCPLVTLALITFNQEKFIHEALIGAVSQTYSNLEIIVSDDFSSDGTYKLVEQFFQNYHGPHKIIINRNSENLGIGRHINKINDLASGDLVVAAAGDDVSFDHRVSDLVAFWLANGKPAAMCSQAIVISTNGEIISDRFRGYDGAYPFPGESRSESIKRLISKDHCILLGCTEAWVPDVFTKFGRLNSKVVHEDNVISLRAWLLNGVAYLDAPLVKYRTHDTNIAFQVAKVPHSISDFVKRELVFASRQLNKIVNLQHYLADLRIAQTCDLLGDVDLNDGENVIKKRIQIHESRGLWWEYGIFGKIKTLVRSVNAEGVDALYWMLPRLLGLRAFSAGRSLVAWGSRRRRQFFGYVDKFSW